MPAARPAGGDNKRAAERDTAQLLRRLQLPRGAVPLSRGPSGDGGLLKHPESVPSGLLVDRHRLWRVHDHLSRVVAFVERHVPRGGRTLGTGSAGGSGVPANASMTFSFSAIAGRISLREVEVTLVALRNHTTGVRADAQDIWVLPRSPSENVPATVREIDVRTTRAHVRVTAPSRVRRIIRWFDALPIVQPGVFHCLVPRLKPVMTLRFRSETGVMLAKAQVPHAVVNGFCAPIRFWIGGRPQTPLGGRRFYQRIERLLGVRFG